MQLAMWMLFGLSGETLADHMDIVHWLYIRRPYGDLLSKSLCNVQINQSNVQIRVQIYSNIVQYKTGFLTDLGKLWQQHDMPTF